MFIVNFCGNFGFALRKSFTPHVSMQVVRFMMTVLFTVTLYKHSLSITAVRAVTRSIAYSSYFLPTAFSMVLILFIFGYL